MQHPHDHNSIILKHIHNEVRVVKVGADGRVELRALARDTRVLRQEIEGRPQPLVIAFA